MARELKPVNRHKISSVAATLRRLGSETERLAKAMEDEPFNRDLLIDGGANMEKGLKDIATWLGKCQSAYARADLPGGDAPESPTKKPPKR